MKVGDNGDDDVTSAKRCQPTDIAKTKMRVLVGVCDIDKEMRVSAVVVFGRYKGLLYQISIHVLLLDDQLLSPKKLEKKTRSLITF